MLEFTKTENFKRFASGIILGFCFFGAYLHSQVLFNFILLAILLISLFFEWRLLIPFTGINFYLISLVYPILPVLSLIYLNQAFRKIDILIPLYPFIISWVGDSFAYIFGKLFGKHKICPSISPGKSWEGLIAGFIGIFIFNIIYLPGLNIEPFNSYIKNFYLTLIISLLITIIAFLGDIFVSFLKRKRGLKDTGNLLPGHGGLLDRFDSVFFVAILITLIIIINKIF